MPIRVEREPKDWGQPHERCAFCWFPTPYWYMPRDVAVCKYCAGKVSKDDVPSKVEWMEQTKGLHQ
jgi:hypothetical protein